MNWTLYTNRVLSEIDEIADDNITISIFDIEYFKSLNIFMKKILEDESKKK